MIKTLRKLFLLALLNLALLASFSSQPALAQSWDKYHDEDGLFRVLIPPNYKINKKLMRMTDEQVAISGEVVGVIDQRPYRDTVKNYIIKYEQTLAHTITQNDITDLVSRELEKYVKYYSTMGGVLRDEQLGTFNGRPGGEIMISYRDKERGIQSVRVRILLSETMRVEQIVMGPEDSMYAMRTKEFFDSLVINDGRTNIEGDLKDEWKTHMSPFELTAQLVPPKNPPFIPENTEFENSDKVERLSLKVVDPVYGQTLFYNVYGYRFNTLLSGENVQRVLMDRHLKKFRVNIRDLKFAIGSKGDYPILSTKMHFSPPDKFPYMNTIKLNAYYYGNFLAVQEIAGNNIHVESDIARNLVRFFDFDPLRAHNALIKERAEKAMQNIENEG
ncbi:MAG: hypothetical protein ACLFR0_06165 [Alphaproteobacteria bacterium]